MAKEKFGNATGEYMDVPVIHGSNNTWICPDKKEYQSTKKDEEKKVEGEGIKKEVISLWNPR